MFSRSRHNLARWFTLSMGGILILFAIATYYLRAEDKMRATDQLLYKKARILEASLQYELSEGKLQVDLDNVPLLGIGLQPLDTDLVYVRWYDAQRQLQRFSGIPPSEGIIRSPGFRTVKLRTAKLRTVKQSNLTNTESALLRQVTLPVQQGDTLVGYLQIAIALDSIQADLQQFQLAITLTVLITLVLIGLVGWHLGGLAMQPIQQAYNQLQRFTADASHELRSPLSASLTNAQVAQSLAANHPEIQPFLENIIDSTQSMNSLVTSLLLLARHQGRLAPESLKPINLNAFLKALTVEYAARSNAENIEFIVPITERPVEVWGDPDLLKQAVENLLSNAYKYTPAAGTVWLRLETRSREAIIQVVDTGIGIPAADLPYIFDRFYRVDTQRTRNSNGFGLGLAIVQQIIQAHGGQVWATSVEHKGATFQIMLPIRNRS